MECGRTAWCRTARPWCFAREAVSSGRGRHNSVKDLHVASATIRGNSGPKLLIAVATYNERENVPGLVEALLNAYPTASVLVVDDNSPDGTGQWAQEQAAGNPRLGVIVRPGKMGLGSALLLAMRRAVAERYDYLVHMDADGSHDPRCIQAMLEQVERPCGDTFQRCDCVIGSRYVPGGQVVGWPAPRKWMSWALNGYTRWLLGLPVRDCSSGFRLYRTEMLARVDFSTIRAKGYAFLEEMLWHLMRAGCTFCEVPITFVNRQRGRSKINWREAVAALWHVTRLALGYGGVRASRRNTSMPRTKSSSDAA